MRNKLVLALIVLMSLTLAGCGGRKTVKENIPVAGAGAGGDGSGVTTVTPDEGLASTGFGPTVTDANDPLSKRVIYFDYDSSSLDAESQSIAEAHAKWMVANPTARVVLEGNADERGTREYNLALGEDRAKAVARIMEALGVSADRIQVVSYGEERPVALGHDESAWALNRRVEIVYGG